MKDITVYQVRCLVTLKQDIELVDLAEKFSKILDERICLKLGNEYHTSRDFKEYCFDSFYKIETDRIYKAGKSYIIRIRTIRDDLCKTFIMMEDYENDLLKIVKTEFTTVPRTIIDKLYTLTPALLKAEDGYWKFKHNYEFYKEALITNTVKKFKTFTKCDLSKEQLADFFEGIQFKNTKAIRIIYKNINLFGDKFEITIKKDELSQKIAYMLLGVGIMQNNSRGYGFCLPTNVKVRK